MNIAVLAHVHYSISQPYNGGLEAHTDQLVKQLVKNGHIVTLYAKAGSKSCSNVVSIFSGKAWDGKNKFIDLGYKYACSHMSLSGYDLIINNSLHSYPLKWHKPSMPPMITIFHTPPIWEITDVLAAQPPQSNRSYISVSELTANQWKPFVSDMVHVVPNGIDPSIWTPNTNASDTNGAIWFGRITPEKGTHIAIEAALIAKISLEICGPIYDETYFKDTIEPYLKHTGITYSGPINQKSINEKLKQKRVTLITPLWDEPFGLTTIESLASGTPVAALDHGATSTILVGKYGALAESDAPEDLAAAITRAVDIDRAMCADYAQRTFSLASMVQSYLAKMPQESFAEGSLALGTY